MKRNLNNVFKNKKGIATINNFILIIFLLLIFFTTFYFITKEMRYESRQIMLESKVKNCASIIRTELINMVSVENITKKIEINCFDDILFNGKNSSLSYFYENNKHLIQGNLTLYGVQFCEEYNFSNKNSVFKFNYGCISLIN